MTMINPASIDGDRFPELRALLTDSRFHSYCGDTRVLSIEGGGWTAHKDTFGVRIEFVGQEFVWRESDEMTYLGAGLSRDEFLAMAFDE